MTKWVLSVTLDESMLRKIDQLRGGTIRNVFLSELIGRALNAEGVRP